MGHHEHDHGEGNRRALAIVLALTAGFTVVEIVGGLLTGSLALLADAGHMLSDNLSLGIALFAAWLAQRPATPNKSFGYRRAEILAALANGVTLVVVAVWIFVEAYSRFRDPPEVLGTPMLAVAALGLIVNVVGAIILYRSGGESLNVEGAMRHVFADALGSVGAIVAAVVIILTGWRYADPLTSVAIGILILGSSWKLLERLDQHPPGSDPPQPGRLRSGQEDGLGRRHRRSPRPPHLDHNLGLPRPLRPRARRRPGRLPRPQARTRNLLAREYGVSHTTLQVDHIGDHDASLQTLRFPSYPDD